MGTLDSLESATHWATLLQSVVFPAPGGAVTTYEHSDSARCRVAIGGNTTVDTIGAGAAKQCSLHWLELTSLEAKRPTSTFKRTSLTSNRSSDVDSRACPPILSTAERNCCASSAT